MTLKRFSLLSRAAEHYTALTNLGQAEVICSNGYVARLVTSSYEQKVGIEVRSGEVYWFPDVTIFGSLYLIKELMGV